jgi:hypothetical protein
MPLAIRDLSVLAYANSFTLWHYKSNTDTLAEINADDYFVEAGHLTKGDIIMVSGSNGARMRVVLVVERTTVITGPMA